ncbi:MAG: hypothetical protein R2879_01165 [Saprospiraceae bacterium]
MSIYRQKSNWKIYLAIAGIFIVAFSAWFTFNVTQKLAIEEQNKVEQWAFALNQLDTSLDDCDYTIHQKIISSNTTIPVILENLDGGIDALSISEKKRLR